MTVNKFENARTGQMRDAPSGFSWTTLLFGPLPALLRGHWIGAVFITICAIFSFGLSSIVFAFFYNDWYVSHLRNEGFTRAENDAAPKTTIPGQPRALPKAYVAGDR